MSTERKSAPDVKNSSFLVDAAFEHGERTGNDGEIATLQCFLRTAFELLNGEQKRRFYSDGGVQESLKAARVVVPEALVRELGDAEPTRVGIRLEGGAIQSVFSTAPAQVDVINYDLDDAPPQGYETDTHLVGAFPRSDGGWNECVLVRYDADVMPAEFPKIDRAFANAREALVMRQEDGDAPAP